jgi:SAM-dependent methyltransferase
MHAGPHPEGVELPFSPAAERNRQPILELLERLLPARARVLEVASGTGQHAQHCAASRSGWTWWPTEAEPARLAVIDARCAGLPNVRPAQWLDVLAAPWPVPGAEAFDAVFCANLLHIAPWPVCAGLMRGAAACLAPGGLLAIYGPFRVDGVPTAPSNEAFDAELRARDPRWGLRRLADVQEQAGAAGLALRESAPLPANNRLLVFGRAAATT